MVFQSVSCINFASTFTEVTNLEKVLKYGQSLPVSRCHLQIELVSPPLSLQLLSFCDPGILKSPVWIRQHLSYYFSHNSCVYFAIYDLSMIYTSCDEKGSLAVWIACNLYGNTDGPKEDRCSSLLCCKAHWVFTMDCVKDAVYCSLSSTLQHLKM